MARTPQARAERIDIHNRITTRIIADLEQGVTPWTRPWTRSAAGPISRPLRHSGERYSGINTILLWIEALERDFTSPFWMTFRQAAALGGHVRKGETGSTVVCANRLTKTETDDSGGEIERHIPFLKAYTVFNVAQIDDLPERYTGPASILDEADRITEAEGFFANTGIMIRHGGDEAYYRPSTDDIRMPAFGAFTDPHAYYATLAHEACHATGHASRLDRDFSGRFGDTAYAREELVAELGAAFVCADIGIALEPRADHAGYIAHWLEVLKNDKRFIVSAAAHAQRAADWLYDRQSQDPG